MHGNRQNSAPRLDGPLRLSFTGRRRVRLARKLRRHRAHQRVHQQVGHVLGQGACGHMVIIRNAYLIGC